MASSSNKGNLTVGGPSLDKSKLQFRRPTPDSEVLASSDDDRDHVRPAVRPGALAVSRRMSSGNSWLHDIQPNRKPSLPSVSFADLQPTTPASEFPRPGSSALRGIPAASPPANQARASRTFCRRPPLASSPPTELFPRPTLTTTTQAPAKSSASCSTSSSYLYAKLSDPSPIA